MSVSIQVLPPEVINRIAAGEVVERPASVLKELVENALDAGARTIDIFVVDGGKTLLKVVDDGAGMTPDNLALALESHATSKISRSEDLEAIATFGFRGEALASIAAVSILEIQSATGQDGTGASLRAEGGVLREIQPVVRERGTTVTVRNLFFNTPGRQKFQRSSRVEMRYINRAFRQVALAFPDRYFQLTRGETTLLRLPSGTVQDRVIRLFSQQVGDNLVPVEEEDGTLQLRGFIAHPHLVQSWRGEQFLFVNNRFVRHRGINHAVQSAYGHSVESHQTPFFVLSLTIPGEQVDVNVHPAKMEIRFQDEQKLYRFCYHSVQQALGALQESPTVMTFDAPSRFVNPLRDQTATRQPADTSMPLNLAHPYAFPVDTGTTIPPGTNGYDPSLERIWQVHNKYILSQVKSGLVVIDQHNAHEQILYERTLTRIQEGAGKSQQLLFPLTIELDIDDLLALTDVTSTLQKIGFELKLFGERTLVVEGKPPEIRQGTEERVLRDFFAGYRGDEFKEFDGFNRVAALYACHAAIRTGEPLEVIEMQQLVNDLFRTKSPYFCPHGRPIVVNLSLEELDRRFLRS